MSSDIKNEFEEYVKTLTETICNDIFLEKLERICHEYEDGFNQVQQTSEQMKQTVQKMDAAGQSVSRKLNNIVTPQQLEQFKESLEKSVETSRQMTQFINETYQKEVEQQIRSIITENEEVQQKLSAAVDSQVQNLLAKLENSTVQVNDTVIKNVAEFTEYTKQQKQNIEKLIQEADRHYEQADRQLKDTLGTFIAEQKKLEETKAKNNEMIEKNAQSRSFKMYMVFSNTVLTALFILLIILQKPWEVFGLQNSLIAAAVFAAVFLLEVILRRIISKALAKRQFKKQSKSVN